VLNIYTDFHKTFADKHYLQALAGFNQEYSYWNNFWTKREDLITPSLPTIQLATGSVSNLQDINELALRGLFLRVNYIYDNKYILEFDGRRDGTSRYPKDSRWGFFPSASAAWVVSQEQFFSGISDALKISNLKFRGSYGALGNQAIGNNYPYLATMGSGNIGTRLDNNYPMGINQPGTVPGDLTWEKVRTVNGAVEIGLFDNKFDLGFDIYTRYTEGMLTKSKTLPALYGADSPNTNAANLKTKGWELSLGYRDRVNVGGSPLSFSARFMLWDSRAWITKFDNPDKNIGDHYEGKELGEIWGLHTLGFFSSNEEAAAWVDQSAVGSPFMNNMFYAGDLKFEDINKDDKINLGKGTVDDPGDRTIIGNNTARLLYSFEGNVEWKGFDLRVFIQGVGKRDWYPSGSYRSFWGFYNMRWINHTYEHLDRWTEDNPNGYFPRLKERIANDGELKYEQTKYMQDASYMRLKNLTVGYTLPSTLTNKWKIERMRIYFSGENIWTLSHIRMPWIDPETYNQNEYYPLQKTWSIGLNLNF
jgi:TonB-linked SusC/RagA family outer membrane protein